MATYLFTFLSVIASYLRDSSMCCLGGTMSHVLGPNNVYLGYFCLAKYQNHEYYYFKAHCSCDE